jgi:hypothetical protein
MAEVDGIVGRSKWLRLKPYIDLQRILSELISTEAYALEH